MFSGVSKKSKKLASTTSTGVSDVEESVRGDFLDIEFEDIAPPLATSYAAAHPAETATQSLRSPAVPSSRQLLCSPPPPPTPPVATHLLTTPLEAVHEQQRRLVQEDADLRRRIHEEADRELLKLHNEGAAMERRIDAKMLQLQMLKDSPGSSADHQRLENELAHLRRSLEDANISRAAAVDRVLEVAQKKQEDALMAQERRHIEALRASQEAATAAFTGLMNKATNDNRELINIFNNSRDEADRATQGVMREMAVAIQAATAANLSVAQTGKESQMELINALNSGFQDLSANYREQNTLMRESLTALTGALVEVHTIIFTSVYSLPQSKRVNEQLMLKQESQVQTMYKSSLRLQGSLNVLTGTPLKPILNFSQPATSFADALASAAVLQEPGSSAMHARASAVLHEAGSSAGHAARSTGMNIYRGEGSLEEREVQVERPQQSPAEVFQQFLREHPDEAQRFLSQSKLKKGNTRR